MYISTHTIVLSLLFYFAHINWMLLVVVCILKRSLTFCMFQQAPTRWQPTPSRAKTQFLYSCGTSGRINRLLVNRTRFEWLTFLLLIAFLLVTAFNCATTSVCPFAVEMYCYNSLYTLHSLLPVCSKSTVCSLHCLIGLHRILFFLSNSAGARFGIANLDGVGGGIGYYWTVHDTDE